jgi:hypothetical protein
MGNLAPSRQIPLRAKIDGIAKMASPAGWQAVANDAHHGACPSATALSAARHGLIQDHQT